MTHTHESEAVLIEGYEGVGYARPLTQDGIEEFVVFKASGPEMPIFTEASELQPGEIVAIEDTEITTPFCWGKNLAVACTVVNLGYIGQTARLNVLSESGRIVTINTDTPNAPRIIKSADKVSLSPLMPYQATRILEILVSNDPTSNLAPKSALQVGLRAVAAFYSRDDDNRKRYTDFLFRASNPDWQEQLQDLSLGV